MRPLAHLVSCPLASVFVPAVMLVIAAMGLAHPPRDVLLLAILLVGLHGNGMTSAPYPARVRTTGMGWTLGIGRMAVPRRHLAQRGLPA